MGARQRVSEARGVARRQAIIAATLSILRADGPDGVTHRTVAAAAQVPLAATTYYFSSKEDLLQEALKELAAEEVVRLEGLAEVVLGRPGRKDLVPTAAAALAGALLAERDGMPAKFAVYLEAARHPALREATAHWIAAFRDLAERLLVAAGAPEPEEGAALLVAAVDGMMLHGLATGQAPAEGELRARLERLMRSLTVSG